MSKQVIIRRDSQSHLDGPSHGVLHGTLTHIAEEYWTPRHGPKMGEFDTYAEAAAHCAAENQKISASRRK